MLVMGVRRLFSRGRVTRTFFLPKNNKKTYYLSPDTHDVGESLYLCKFIRPEFFEFFAWTLSVESVTFPIVVVKNQAWRTKAWCAHSLS
jgi:hypothetical protein